MTDSPQSGPCRCLIGLPDDTHLPVDDGSSLTWHAFGLRHELIVYGDNRARLDKISLELRQASIEAERCVGRQPGNELDTVNDFGATAKIRVSPTLYTLLLTAKHLWRQTLEAYEPSADVVARGDEAPSYRSRISPLRRLELDPGEGTVRVRGERVCLDLSDLGVGWLHDQFLHRAAREGIRSGLLTSGEHHVTALGPPPFGEAWPLEIAADLTSARRIRVPLRFASGVLTACQQARRLEDADTGGAWPVAVATASGLEGVAFARSARRVAETGSLVDLAGRLGGHGVWLARQHPATIEAYLMEP